MLLPSLPLSALTLIVITSEPIGPPVPATTVYNSTTVLSSPWQVFEHDKLSSRNRRIAKRQAGRTESDTAPGSGSESGSGPGSGSGSESGSGPGSGSGSESASGPGSGPSDSGSKGNSRLSGCSNPQMEQIMQRQLGPLMNMMNMSRIGDIAKRLQVAVQMATGKSMEVMMGKSDLNMASHAKSDAGSCRLRIGEFETVVYESPVQHNIFNLAEEQFMSNIDFGEPLGGSESPFLPNAATQLGVQPPVQPLAQPPIPPPAPPPPIPPVNAPPIVPPPVPPVPPPVVPPVVPPALQCFSGDLIVETIEGPRRMSELKTGDQVLSIDEDLISFTPIVMFLHRDEDQPAEFNLITTANGYSVKLTNDHLIYVTNCETTPIRLVSAKEVTTENCLMIALSRDRGLRANKVVGVTKVFEKGIYAPLTSTGDIIVNDVLSSCHSNLAARTLQLAFFTAYRCLSVFLPEEGALPLSLAYLTTKLDLFVPHKAAFV